MTREHLPSDAGAFKARFLRAVEWTPRLPQKLDFSDLPPPWIYVIVFLVLASAFWLFYLVFCAVWWGCTERREFGPRPWIPLGMFLFVETSFMLCLVVAQLEKWDRDRKARRDDDDGVRPV